MAQTVHVNRANIADAVLVDHDLPALAENAVRLKVDSFAVTANNVTYAVAGDMLGYWNFFPAPDGLGVVPMWGHARVAQSNHPQIAAGERVYGYLPMGTHLDVTPDKISPGQFFDAAAHRRPMSPIYSLYSRLAGDPEHDPAREGARMVFGPLFKTGFLIEAMLRREHAYGAKTLVMTSASSKTALSLASVTRANSPDLTRIGLTSTANLAFVRRSGLFDRVLDYRDIATLPSEAAVCVDLAGDGRLLAQIHHALGDALAYSCLVGVTHVAARGQGEAAAPPGPVPVFFFAPDHAAAAIKDLGAQGFADAVAARWRTFLIETDGFVRIETRAGLAAARDAFVATVKGHADPAVGVVVQP